METDHLILNIRFKTENNGVLGRYVSYHTRGRILILLQTYTTNIYSPNFVSTHTQIRYLSMHIVLYCSHNTSDNIHIIYLYYVQFIYRSISKW